MSKEFKREDRYIVIKRSELACLSAPELVELEMLLGRIRLARTKAKKPPLQCVIVESDWLIYEEVWKLVELEAQGAEQPASEDAWLRKSLQLTAKIRDAADDESSAAYFDQLEHHLRNRPAREGFVLVPVEPTQEIINAAMEVAKFQYGFGVKSSSIYTIYKAMIEAAKGAGK